MKNGNTFTYLGLLFNLVWLLAARFALFPIIIESILIVLGMSLMTMGLYMESHKIKTISKLKECLFRKLSH